MTTPTTMKTLAILNPDPPRFTHASITIGALCVLGIAIFAIPWIFHANSGCPTSPDLPRNANRIVVMRSETTGQYCLWRLTDRGDLQPAGDDRQECSPAAQALQARADSLNGAMMKTANECVRLNRDAHSTSALAWWRDVLK